MAFARIYALMQASASSDYELPQETQVVMTDTSTGDVRVEDVFTTASGAATTYGLSHMSDVSWLLVKNTDSSTTVEVKINTQAGTTGAQFDLAAGEWICLPDVDPAGDLTLTPASGTVKVQVSYEGTV